MDFNFSSFLFWLLFFLICFFYVNLFTLFYFYFFLLIVSYSVILVLLNTCFCFILLNYLFLCTLFDTTAIFLALFTFLNLLKSLFLIPLNSSWFFSCCIYLSFMFAEFVLVVLQNSTFFLALIHFSFSVCLFRLSFQPDVLILSL